MTTEAVDRAVGRVVQVLGPVIDVEFPADNLTQIYDAVEIIIDGQDVPLIAEVQQHLGNDWVRTVAMDSTDGLQRGAKATATGAPITVPVGEGTLGRIFNVLGR